jgi:RNA 3'-terminal phosphate cyclase (ATP)
MDRGDSVEINGIALAAGKLYSTAACDEMKKRAESSLKKAFPNISINIRSVYESNSASSGTSMVLALKTSSGCILGGDAIGDHKGVQTPIDVANDAVKELKRAWDLNACVDEWLQDQLIVFMALAEGRSQMNSGPLSLHTQTAIYCAEKLTTSRFTVTSKEEEKDSGASEMISCQGIGHFNHNLS